MNRISSAAVLALALASGCAASANKNAVGYDGAVVLGGGDAKNSAFADTHLNNATDSAVDTATDSAADSTPAAPAPPCPKETPCVLFYGPIVYNIAAGGMNDPAVDKPFEQAFLPKGAVVTIAGDAKWKSMTRADFAKFNLIVIGDNLDWHPQAPYLQTAFETRTIWNPAITGRVIVQGIDAGFHTSHSDKPAAAGAYLTMTLRWLTSGPGTALYVSSIAREYDYLGSIGAFTSVAQGGELVSITEPAHPIFLGSTSDSLSAWKITYHRIIQTFPIGFRAVAKSGEGDAGSAGPVVVIRDRD